MHQIKISFPDISNFKCVQLCPDEYVWLYFIDFSIIGRRSIIHVTWLIWTCVGAFCLSLVMGTFHVLLYMPMHNYGVWIWCQIGNFQWLVSFPGHASHPDTEGTIWHLGETHLQCKYIRLKIPRSKFTKPLSPWRGGGWGWMMGHT